MFYDLHTFAKYERKEKLAFSPLNVANIDYWLTSSFFVSSIIEVQMFKKLNVSSSYHMNSAGK